MKKNTLSPLHALLFSLILIFQFSCSKDSDLFTDYVLADAKEDLDIGKFVIDDTFKTAIVDPIVLDVLANDAFENTEEVVVTKTTAPASGTVEINSDNTLTYTPDPAVIEQVSNTTNNTIEVVEDTFTYSTEIVNEDESVSTETGKVVIIITSGNGVNLLSNGTFANDDEWSLLNGSTATGGVLTVVANGNIAADFPNWSAQYVDILPQTTYEVRRYRLTFTARRTVGSGELQIGQRFSIIPHESLTGTFASYVIEFNGEGGSGGNDLVFGGATPGDTFEFTDMVLEDIGASTEDGAGGTGSSAQLAFYTDFETVQWGDNGVPEPQGNYWEVDHGLPRTTDHPDSPLKAGRNGTGRALWLGSYNGDSSRNEVGKDNALSFAEHWMGVSIYVQNKLDKTRLMIQNRLIANGSSNTVNAISLRQGDPGKLYFSIPTDVNSVDTLPTNGAGSNTESVLFDYNEGEWIDIVLHYKGAFGADYQGADTSELARSLGFDPRSDGFIEIWVNGEKLVDHVGTTAYRYAREGQEISGIITPKIGPYWSDALSPNGDVYYDNYRLWVGPDGTYQDIDPSK